MMNRQVLVLFSLLLFVAVVGTLVVSLYSPAREAVFGKALLQPTTIQKVTTEPLLAVLATTPISACGPLNTAGTTYQLTQDVQASGSCFTDFADNVVLDCQGHKITGTLLPDGSLAGHGVSVNGVKGITIKNCVVSKFFSGIILEDATSSTLSNNEAFGNRFGIVVSVGSSATVSGNRACENSGQDFRCAQDDTVSASGTGNTFSSIMICPYILWPQVNVNYAECVDELLCKNYVDDDGDTRPDCLDYDCAAEPACSVLKSCTSATAAADCPASGSCTDTATAPGNAFTGYCAFESYCLVGDVSVIPEQCDGKDNDCDGKIDEGLIDCFVESAPSPVCGDGVVESPEACDDSNMITEICSYGQPSCQVCNSACALVPGATSYCGDNKVDTTNGEACDGSSRDCKLIDGSSGAQQCLADCLGWNKCTALSPSKTTTEPVQVVGGGGTLPLIEDADGDGIPDTADTLCITTPPGKRMGPDGCMIGDFNHDDAVTSEDMTQENLRAQWSALGNNLNNLFLFNTFIQDVRANMMEPS